MNNTYVFVAVIAYLLGSIPFGLILTRIFLGTDVRKIGSGNIGATNVMRTGSKKLGVATLVLDAAKGYAAVVAARVIAVYTGAALYGDGRITYRLLGLAAVAAMVGHIFPVWLKFKGGKGVATGVGVFLAVAPKAVLIVLGIFAIIFAVSRYVSLASITATAAFPLFAYMLMKEQHTALMPFIIAAAVLIIAKHHQNIRRLLSGTENRLELRSSK
ncbi:MAG TPA: glycerol-3-phosphate 1-O-acyltransferase PlsY [Terriglobales bacterium]|nr:glycerol-3-phosphate 1-O-acyltransferase PlsY [Terriglobales bacterium]